MTDVQKSSASRHLELKRISLPETLAESLRERILSGEFREGEQIRQEAVANEYKVSRMPVREALRQLEATGLVELQLHRGAIVTVLPIEEIGELFDLRALLECDALRRAVPLMRDSDLERSAAVMAQLEDAYHEEKIATWGALNAAFHESLYAPAGRARSLGLIRMLNTQTELYIRMQLLATKATKRAEEDHRELLRLCGSRQTDEAVAFLRSHILQAGEDLVETVKRRRAK